MKSAQRLTIALENAGAPQAMIDRAKMGYYGDFTSPIPAPITQLVHDLKQAGLHSLANKAMVGEFDGD